MPIIDPAELQKFKDALSEALIAVTKQSQADLKAFVEVYAPLIAELAPRVIAGDAAAIESFNDLKVQAIVEAATYSVNIQAQGEATARALWDIVIRIVVKAIGGA